jgi:hypothetical protein
MASDSMCLFRSQRMRKLSTEIFYVYEHWRPDEGVIFYVGKGQKRRAWDLRWDRNVWHGNITNKLSKLGLSVEVRIIQSSMTEEAAFALEIELISSWREKGAKLVNQTAGGEGNSGRTHTDETREKLRQKMLGRKMTPEWRAKIGASNKGRAGWSRGKKLSAAHIKAAADGLRGRKHSEEARAAMRAAKSSPEWKESFGSKQRGVPKSPKQIEKMRIANIGKTHGNEARRKVSEFNLKAWADPAYREKQRLARLASWARRKAAQLQE